MPVLLPCQGAGTPCMTQGTREVPSLLLRPLQNLIICKLAHPCLPAGKVCLYHYYNLVDSEVAAQQSPYRMVAAGHRRLQVTVAA